MTSLAAKPVRIAVDIGGTFTDLQIFDGRGPRVFAWKTPTTPADPSQGLMTGIKEAAAMGGFALGEVGAILHGTTIATNAVLERKLPKGAMLTTAGFEDVLEIGRHIRREIYTLRQQPVPVLIPRDLRFGVPERMTARGAPERPLDEAALDRVLERLDAAGVEAVAVCLLNSYANPAHEQRLKEILVRRRQSLAVSLSSEISPEMREYERASTTVLNALLMPVVRSYLERLQRRFDAESFAPLVYLVQSNGGVCGIDAASAQPARLLLSGPSGGALAARRMAEALALPNLVGIDMGGTSFDVSVVQDGRISLVTQGEVDRLPVRLPMVEIRTIGAGGGSIAAVDASGRLTVGPRSAGADPGPVAYAKGGDEPTVTDANIALGRLDPAHFMGGAMQLDGAAARRAIETRIGARLGLGRDEAAAGMIRVTNTNLGAAIRLSLFEKGLDPRDFALLSFGGAGGLHATEVAAELNIGRVVFPPDPGTFSAYGILHSDIVQDVARSKVMPAVPASLAELGTIVGELRRQAEALLDRDGVARESRRTALSADMRYHGQAFELLVPWQAEAIDAAALERLIADFHALHKQRFSYADDVTVEIVTLRVTATGLLPKPEAAYAAPEGEARPHGRRRVLDGAGWAEIPVYLRDELPARARLEGPLVVEEPYTTIYVSAGWVLTRGAAGALVATRREA